MGINTVPLIFERRFDIEAKTVGMFYGGGWGEGFKDEGLRFLDGWSMEDWFGMGMWWICEEFEISKKNIFGEKEIK